MEGGLGALQAHLPPVRDGLQLHGVAAVLLQPLQVQEGLRLRRHTNTPLALLASLRIHARRHSGPLPFQKAHRRQLFGSDWVKAGPRGEPPPPPPPPPLLGTHVVQREGGAARKIAFRALGGSRVIRASQGFLAVFGLQHSSASVSLMSSCFSDLRLF